MLFILFSNKIQSKQHAYFLLQLRNPISSFLFIKLHSIQAKTPPFSLYFSCYLSLSPPRYCPTSRDSCCWQPICAFPLCLHFIPLQSN